MESEETRFGIRRTRTLRVTAPASARQMQVQDEVEKRQLLNAFGKTGDLPVRDLSSEALLIEHIGHLTQLQPAQPAPCFEISRAIPQGVVLAHPLPRRSP